jgi:tetratricopeptide (TPR) repeat protein
MFYEKNIKLDPEAISTRSRLANLHYRTGSFQRAIELNEEITRIDPEESLPYVNIGNYYFLQRDTVSAVKYYEKAVTLGAPAVASQFLAKYYQDKGDFERAAYYQRIASELRDKQQYFVPSQD